MKKTIYKDRFYHVFHAWCNSCDFEDLSHVDGPKNTRKHIRETGHSVNVECGHTWSLKES
jgi:hypothetical protein